MILQSFQLFYNYKTQANSGEVNKENRTSFLDIISQHFARVNI